MFATMLKDCDVGDQQGQSILGAASMRSQSEWLEHVLMCQVLQQIRADLHNIRNRPETLS